MSDYGELHWGKPTIRAVFLIAIMALSGTSSAESVDNAPPDWESRRRQIEALRLENQELKDRLRPIESRIESVMDNKYGADSNVNSKTGHLTISGLVQIWYYNIQKDPSGLFNSPVVNGIQDSNQGTDTDSFRIRRTELRFDLKITQNIKAEVLIDPARESTSFVNFPDNQANQIIFKRLVNTNIANLQTGSGSAPRMLHNAFIEYDDLIPHHDFKIGQFKPPVGEEGLMQSANLDFIERSFIGQLTDQRDQGFTAHGTWWDSDDNGNGRFQYWLGAFNAPGNFFGSGGQFQNRADDNSAKDIAYRVLLRPLWKDCKWGNLEIGYSSQFGEHGGGGEVDPIDNPGGGLNRRRTWAIRDDGWISYAPEGMAAGLWIKGEYEWQRDRNAPQTVYDILGQGNAGDGSTQTNGKAFSTQGFYTSIGYRFAKTPDIGMPRWARNFEVLFRYEQYQNVQVADSRRPDRTDVYKTTVYTPGVNYHISGNTKVAFNYNFLENPVSNNGFYRFHNVKNDNFILEFQVAF